MVGKRKITIEHVASQAGVSIQTVSRVLNDRPDVSPETRQMVQQIIAELGYKPSAIARSLASKHTRTLGLITADFSDYFFTQVIAGAESEARKHGYFLMLSSTEQNLQDEPEYLRLLSERHVEGILLARAGNEPNPDLVTQLLQEGIPVVSTAHHTRQNILPVVDIDNVDGGIQATRELVAGGHTQLAMITGPLHWESAANRAEGFHQVLDEAGLTVDPRMVIESDWSYRGGYEAAGQLITRRIPFTALFAHNDQMAIGAIRALRDAGRRMPEDVSIIGYDDIPGAEFSDPPLTTIRQPMQEVGKAATRLLIHKIENGSEGTPGEILLKTRLIRRASTYTTVRS